MKQIKIPLCFFILLLISKINTLTPIPTNQITPKTSIAIKNLINKQKQKIITKPKLNSNSNSNSNSYNKTLTNTTTKIITNKSNESEIKNLKEKFTKITNIDQILNPKNNNNLKPKINYIKNNPIINLINIKNLKEKIITKNKTNYSKIVKDVKNTIPLIKHKNKNKKTKNILSFLSLGSSTNLESKSDESSFFNELEPTKEDLKDLEEDDDDDEEIIGDKSGNNNDLITRKKIKEQEQEMKMKSLRDSFRKNSNQNEDMDMGMGGLDLDMDKQNDGKLKI